MGILKQLVLTQDWSLVHLNSFLLDEWQLILAPLPPELLKSFKYSRSDSSLHVPASSLEHVEWAEVVDSALLSVLGPALGWVNRALHRHTGHVFQYPKVRFVRCCPASSSYVFLPNLWLLPSFS